MKQYFREVELLVNSTRGAINRRSSIGHKVDYATLFLATTHCASSIFHMWTAPSLQGVLQCFDQIACVHMSGLFVRSHMNAGQDGFRDNSSKQNGDLIEGHWKMRNFSRRGSTDHTICLLSCKFRPQLSTVAVELLPCLADL